MSASPRLFRGDRSLAQLDAAHRGIAYGDGLFETMRVHHGAVHWWPRHWQRLATGAQGLGLHLPAQSLIEAEIQTLLADADAQLQLGSVLKLIVSRSPGGRGYGGDANTCDWQLSLHPLPPTPRPGGLHLRWCDLRLAAQPVLAGLKHCNRLENVLARNEWADADIDEGLLCDAHGHVICATAANVFALHDGRWHTPRVDACGVAGVCRSWALQALQAREAHITPAQLEQAQAIFLCNAVRGILPVARVGTRTLSPHPALYDAQRQLAAAHPAFDL